MKTTIRNCLDKLYLLSGGIAGIAVVVLLQIIFLQMVTRWFGITVLGLAVYAGYCMAASLFFGLGRGRLSISALTR
jgi:hypothetical protein